jgi:septal ring factor EnvC (AmiA/AmiB activator)
VALHNGESSRRRATERKRVFIPGNYRRLHMYTYVQEDTMQQRVSILQRELDVRERDDAAMHAQLEERRRELAILEQALDTREEETYELRKNIIGDLEFDIDNLSITRRMNALPLADCEGVIRW